MNKLYAFLIFFLILVITLPFISSNFVCGVVGDSNESSSSWKTLIVYQEAKPFSFIKCKVNPESKFCCDLDELSATPPNPGDKVFAEVFDEESGFVSEPVSLVLTGEGYDVFPEMNLQEAITINSPDERIFLNQSSILMNISLAENYENLKYTINSSDGFFIGQACTDCANSIFSLNLSKGKNDITLTSYGDRQISENITIYNLDYLNFKINASCNKCILKNNILYVPSGKNVTLYSSFNSSHAISGDFSLLFPLEWTLFNSSEVSDFSTTHQILTESVINRKDFLVIYSFQTPKGIIKQEYSFYQNIENIDSLTKIMVYKLNLIPFHKSKHFEEGYFNRAIFQKASPTEPIVLIPKRDYLELVAIFPNINISKSYSNIKLETKRKGRNMESLFNIITNIPKKNIDKIFIVLRTQKGKNIEIYSNKNKIPLEFYEEDSNYTYYSAFVYEKGPFTVRIF
ncbi:MAG TPA: hypothetical protein VJ438_04005 [Candidatus Nanoarchaeia archaeon]|nr:hypothetical protein [Candidatus Nanoarchaeia archaeon]